ncbi:MAG: ATP-binding cassette domain-containing protein [Pseudomonadota bacterium]|nr:ATP-binding cassette domain-containing protein [Pseudomonadota bacterium]
MAHQRLSAFRKLESDRGSVERLPQRRDDSAGTARTNPGVEVESSESTSLQLVDVDLVLPTGRTLLVGANVELPEGLHVQVCGPSGSGKSTLFRAIAGIWPFGSGTIRLPKAFRVLFLPQRPYFRSVRCALPSPILPARQRLTTAPSRRY